MRCMASRCVGWQYTKVNTVMTYYNKHSSTYTPADYIFFLNFYIDVRMYIHQCSVASKSGYIYSYFYTCSDIYVDMYLCIDNDICVCIYTYIYDYIYTSV